MIFLLLDCKIRLDYLQKRVTHAGQSFLKKKLAHVYVAVPLDIKKKTPIIVGCSFHGSGKNRNASGLSGNEVDYVSRETRAKLSTPGKRQSGSDIGRLQECCALRVKQSLSPIPIFSAIPEDFISQSWHVFTPHIAIIFVYWTAMRKQNRRQNILRQI